MGLEDKLQSSKGEKNSIGKKVLDFVCKHRSEISIGTVLCYFGYQGAMAAFGNPNLFDNFSSLNNPSQIDHALGDILEMIGVCAGIPLGLELLSDFRKRHYKEQELEERITNTHVNHIEPRAIMQKGLLHSFSNQLRFLFAQYGEAFHGANDKLLQRYAALIKDEPQNIEFRLRLMETSGKMGLLEDMFLEAEKIIRIIKENKESASGAYGLSGDFLEPLMKYARFINPSSIFVHVDHAIYALIGNDIKKSLSLFEKAISISPELNQIRCLYANALLAAGFEAEAEQEMRTAIVNLKGERDFRESLLKIEDYEVFEYIKSNLLKNAWIFKESENKIGLQDELACMKDAKRLALSEEFSIANPIMVVQINGESCLVSSRAKGVTIKERVEKTHDYKILNRAGRFTAQIHAKMSPLETRPYFEDFANRVLGSPIPQYLKEKIIDNAPAVFCFGNVPIVFDKDAHGENFIITNGHLVSIDWRKRGAIPSTFDLSKLIKQGNYYSNAEEMDIAAKNILKSYADEFNSCSALQIDNIDEYLYHMLHADVHRAISRFCVTAKDRRIGHVTSISYLKNALHSPVLLEQEYYDLLPMEKRRQIGKLKECLFELLQLPYNV